MRSSLVERYLTKVDSWWKMTSWGLAGTVRGYSESLWRLKEGIYPHHHPPSPAAKYLRHGTWPIANWSQRFSKKKIKKICFRVFVTTLPNILKTCFRSSLDHIRGLVFQNFLVWKNARLVVTKLLSHGIYPPPPSPVAKSLRYGIYPLARDVTKIWNGP